MYPHRYKSWLAPCLTPPCHGGKGERWRCASVTFNDRAATSARPWPAARAAGRSGDHALALGGARLGRQARRLRIERGEQSAHAAVGVGHLARG